MGFATVNGVKLAWQQLGDSGPDLILVHGLATNRAFWFPHAMALQDHFRVTLFDLRGHGYSEVPGSGYRATDMAQDLLGLMDHLGIARAAVAGHSYGGSAALEAAGMAPERFSRLALFDARVSTLQPRMRLHDMAYQTPFELEVQRTTSIDWPQEMQIGFKFLEVVARKRIAGEEFTVRDDFTPFGEGRGALRAAKQWIHLLDNTAADSELHVPGMSAEAIARLPMPLLLMYAEYSRCQPSGEQLHKLLPDARYVFVPKAGHFFPMSHQALVVDELRRFLEPGHA